MFEINFVIKTRDDNNHFFISVFVCDTTSEQRRVMTLCLTFVTYILVLYQKAQNI